MRRILTTGLLSAALLAAAGCADRAPTAPEGTSALSAGQPAGLSNENVCPKLKAALDEFEAEGVPLVAELVSDPSTTEAKLPKVMEIFSTLIAGYGADVAAISDPELKAAVEADLATLKEVSGRISSGEGDIKQMAAELTNPKFQTAGKKVKEICGF